MEVTLTIEAPDGTHSTVSGTADGYQEAKEAAEALIPEGHKTIVIRTDRY